MIGARSSLLMLLHLTLSLSLWRTTALALQGAKPNENSITCPPFQNPNIAALKERRSLGAVHADAVQAKQAATRAEPVHLFLISLPMAGSTALASVIASSPQASLLCAAGKRDEHGWPERCEGVWELIRRGLIHDSSTRWNEQEPADWGAALRVYDHFWNQSLKVHVDKSPPNVAKVHRLASYFEKSKKLAAFIFLTHSSCSPGHQGSPSHHDVSMLAKALRHTGSIPTLVVRYEELLREPYGVAKDILNFLPALESLDPAVQALPSEETDERRDLSVVDYVLSHAPFQGKATTSLELHKVDNVLGYKE
mmetsp:Transcript_70197/g.131248  ORF Transcript_70197/g.131248 Transcript_70197/m.131248 type:complete len:309 (+) Transcript_70197:92-1018(+)